MSCSSSTPLAFNVQYFYNNQCFTCGDDCGPNIQNSKCVVYTGPNLSCSGIETSDSIEVALQKIDEQICSATGDYSSYQMNCLPTYWGQAITTESEFVDAITAYACATNTSLSNFVSITFPSYQSSVNTRFTNIEYPGITCTSAGITSGDSLTQVLNKYCTIIADIEDLIDISGVTWDSCMTVVSPPTTIAEGFSVLADQICQIYNASSSLPIFNNTASCISGGATDSLVTTIGLIKTRLCLSPTWDADNITWGCLTAPTSDTNLEEAIQNIVTVVNTHQQNFVTFDNSDFVISATDGGDPCAGITVALATPINQDRFVAVSAGDASPGTLYSKLSTPNSSVSITNVSDTTVGLDVSAGDKGDITVSGGGNTWTIDNDVVTFAKMQNIATSRLLGRSTGGSGDVEEISVGSGLTLSGGVLSSSISGKSLIGISIFDSSGTWTKPADCTAAIVEIQGAGGGGGGVIVDMTEAAAGSGGAGGSYLKVYIDSGLGATETVTVGVGGAGGDSGTGYVGQAGGNSSFGTFGTAYGGGGGNTMSGGTSVIVSEGGQPQGLPALPLNTITSSGGDEGGFGLRLGTGAGQTVWGKGGNSYFGGNGYGSALHSPGAGGAGNVGSLPLADNTSYDGWPGRNGIVIIYEYS